MKCLLFLFSGLLIACSNPALAQNSCPQTGTGPISAITNSLANTVPQISSGINGLFSSLIGSGVSAVSGLFNTLLMPLQGILTMLASSISTALDTIQSSIINAAGVANTLTNQVLSSAIQSLLNIVPFIDMLDSQMSALVSIIPFVGPFAATGISVVGGIFDSGALLTISTLSAAVALLESIMG